MTIKIDFEKAYDRVNLDFIHDTMHDVGILGNIVEFIWHYISSTSMKVLWNGEALEDFTPSRGIRQGDLLSPYLFVRCIERLFQLINLVVRQGTWKPISLSRHDSPISYLAFADDLILFAEASLEQVMLIKNIMKLFCKIYGQKINLEKSRMFFFKCDI